MMNPTFLRLISALRPNPRFWLLQGIVVPLVALLGGLYIATEAHAGEFDQVYSDYVVQSDASKAFPQAPSFENPIAMPALEMPAYKVHFSNYEYPTQFFGGSPSDPVKLTAFQKYLSTAVNSYETMAFTNHLEEADYRVEIECTGLLLCSRLQLNVYDVHRNFLASLQLPRKRLINSDENLKAEAQYIAESVNKRLQAFPQGGYGTYREEDKGCPADRLIKKTP